VALGGFGWLWVALGGFYNARGLKRCSLSCNIINCAYTKITAEHVITHSTRYGGQSVRVYRRSLVDDGKAAIQGLAGDERLV